MESGNGSWAAQQLAQFQATVSAHDDESSALRAAVEAAAEALEAEVAVIVRAGRVLAAIGFPEGHVPERELVAVAAGAADSVFLPGNGECRVLAVVLEQQVEETWLLLARAGQDEFEREEINLLKAMARSLSLTLSMLRLLDEARRHEQEHLGQAHAFKALYEIGVAASGVLQPDRLCRMIAAKTSELLGGRADTLIYQWDPELGKLVCVASNEDRGAHPDLDPGEGLLGEVFSSGRSLLIHDYQRWPEAHAHGRLTGVRSVAGVPLILGDQVVGTLGVVAREGSLPPRSLWILELLAAEVAPAWGAARSHNALVTSERRLRSVYAAMACGVLVQDAEGLVTEVNQAAVEILGVSRERLLEWSPSASSGPDLDPGHRFLDRLPSRRVTLTGQAIRQLVYKHDHPAGERCLQLDCIPILDGSSRVEQVVTSFIDITAGTQAEEARRESETKSRFLAMMSHELRTPLNSILGFTQLLVDREGTNLDSRRLRYIRNIEASGRHLLTLVNDVLDLSKVAAGRLDLTLDDFELQPLLREVVSRIQPVADLNGIRIPLGPRSTTWVRADRFRTSQILSNLVSNAIKFTPPEGQVAIRCRKRGTWVEIHVIDTGIGIQPEHQEVIFDEFTQVEGGWDRTHEGTGLGLPLSRRLVEMMGGTLQVRSRLGEGSSFIVRLPSGRDPVSSASMPGTVHSPAHRSPGANRRAVIRRQDLNLIPPPPTIKTSFELTSTNEGSADVS